ncbi:hypothetical protein BDY19DRAFT_933711 [Irpex rosettiformis]|uniref:Uncharacterized protein n=1 Tax=Irpex rosettiformis TaxID=378272 RepID=A0ACB8U9V1_9APHY|nr:hypothetical protein BDY19DRAFT_933711 [Irpex rosettiformis]
MMRLWRAAWFIETYTRARDVSPVAEDESEEQDATMGGESGDLPVQRTTTHRDVPNTPLLRQGTGLDVVPGQSQADSVDEEEGPADMQREELPVYHRSSVLSIEHLSYVAPEYLLPPGVEYLNSSLILNVLSAEERLDEEEEREVERMVRLNGAVHREGAKMNVLEDPRRPRPSFMVRIEDVVNDRVRRR